MKQAGHLSKNITNSNFKMGDSVANITKSKALLASKSTQFF